MKEYKHIPIFNVPFSVSYTKLARNLKGDCDIDERKIRIKNSMKEYDRQKTLWHEAVHACLNISGLSELLTDEHGRDNLEEAIVIALENGLFELTVFAQNVEVEVEAEPIRKEAEEP